MDVECQKLEETQYFTLYAQEETNSRLELLEIFTNYVCSPSERHKRLSVYYHKSIFGDINTKQYSYSFANYAVFLRDSNNSTGTSVSVDFIHQNYLVF